MSSLILSLLIMTLPFQIPNIKLVDNLPYNADAFYNGGTISFSKDSMTGKTEQEIMAVFIHEFTHHVQALQTRVDFSHLTCEQRFKIEMQAYDMEDDFRNRHGMEKADRLGTYFYYWACSKNDGN
jgi:hypothetical protein